jgi:hypothetical protein
LPKAADAKNLPENGHALCAVHSNGRAAGLHLDGHYRSRLNVRRVGARQLRAQLPQRRLRGRENGVGVKMPRSKASNRRSINIASLAANRR